MSTTHPKVDEVEAFIAAVKERLAGVPDEERAELLDDVTAHVREVADEFGPDQLMERLGTPEHFSEELRVSAGYAPNDEADLAGAKSPGPLLRWWNNANDRLGTEGKRELWRKLEPGWFVVRGALFGLFVLMVTGVDADALPRLGVVGMAVLAAGAVVSFKLGERRPATETALKRAARITAEAALVVLGLAFLSDASERQVVYYDSQAGPYERDPCLRDSAGRAISNLFAFDTSGQLIPQFFLTDQKGRPIDNLCPDQAAANQFGPAQTTYTRDVNGAQVFNVFPRQQQQGMPDPITGALTWSPLAPPAVLFPQLAPPMAGPAAAPSP